MELSDYNFIKRQRVRQAETKKAITQMRAELPKYNLDEIRQHKLPYHEALRMGLEEKGYVSTSAYIEGLIDYENRLREKAGPQSGLWLRPKLISCKEELKLLCDTLMKIENHNTEGDHDKETYEFLRIAIYFAFLNENWWWLGEELLIMNIEKSAEYEIFKNEALTRYAYAKFLIENFKEYDAAMTELERTRELSRGKGWTTKKLFPNQKDTLYMQTNYLLHLCLIREAKESMKIDYRKAREVAILAKKRAAEACYHEGETKALLLKGVCEMNTSDTKSAISSFNTAYYIQLKLGSERGICEVRIQLAKAYLMHGNIQLSLKTLMLLKESAQKHNLPFYLAEAYKSLGEFYLNNGEPKKATPLLAEAQRIFQEVNDIKKVEQVGILEAVSAGLELFPQYLELLYKCDKSDAGGQNLMMLVDWKDIRKIFWDATADIVSNSIDDIIKAGKVIGEDKQNQTIDDEEKLIIDVHINRHFSDSTADVVNNIDDNIEENLL